MRISWKSKAAIQAVISRAPFGRTVYRKLQRITGTSRLDIADQYGMKSKFVRRWQEQGLAVEGQDFLEIGTGWYPVLPILLHLLGANRVVTIDLNPWLTPASLSDTLEGFESIVDTVAADFSRPSEVLRAKLSALRAAIGQTSLSDVLSIANISYIMPCNACHTNLPDSSFNFIVSSNVLEHIPAGVIRGILQESRRILKPGGYHLHHINPGDHSAFDPRVTTVNFLRYSSRAWYLLGGSGIAYHNRLRCTDYVKMLEDEGFRVGHQIRSVDPRALDLLQSGALKVHSDFAGYSSEELACDLIDVFAFLA